MTSIDYGIVDCDTHCYETRDAFTRYLPKEFLDRAITPVRNAEGQEVILAGGRVATFNSEQGMGFDYAYRPGTLQRNAAPDGVGQPGRDLPARADAAGVPRACPPADRSWSSRVSSSAVLFPADGAGR